jgi:hypothetical protein
MKTKIEFIFFLFSVKTDLNPGGAVSRLYIANANRQDSGNYSCALAEIAQTTVMVHVLNGKIFFIYVFFNVVFYNSCENIVSVSCCLIIVE